MELRPRATTPFNTRERHNIVELRESGFSIRHVKRVTGASRSSQGAFLRAHRQGQSLEPAIPNRKGIRNPMAKITPEWENKLIELLDTPGTLTNAELNQKLEAATGISVDESTIVWHRQKWRSTRKRTTPVEVLDNPDTTRAAQKDFRILLDPSTGTVPYQFCTSTDEAGFNSNEVPTYGYSRVWQTRRVNPARTLSGGSYRDNRSRVSVKKAKTRAFRKHLCLTIGLNESRPVQHFKIIDKFYGGKEFLAYVQERTVTEEFKYDLLDNWGPHRASKKLKAQGLPSIEEAYEAKGIDIVWVPRGSPQFTPVEQALNFVRGEIKRAATKYAKSGQWKNEEMHRELTKALKKITYEQVKGWYRASFRQIFPKKTIPEEPV